MAQAAEKQPSGIAGTELVQMMAKEQHLDAQAYASTVMKSCFDIKDNNRNPINPTPEQFMAFLMIAKEHKLNPITREIYAFAKQGKIQPIVSIDGWLKIINEQPQMDGMQFADNVDDDGALIAVTCRIYRKDRSHPTEVTEYLDECKMPTEPWKKWPARMLRHKATIQAARYAFGFAGIMDPDEVERLKRSDEIQGTAHVVEDISVSPAKRIAQQIKAKAGKEDLAPETDAQEVSGGNAEAVIEDKLEPMVASKEVIYGDLDMSPPTDADVARAKAEEDTAPAIDEIPGLKKASELNKDQQEWVEGMEKDK